MAISTTLQYLVRAVCVEKESIGRERERENFHDDFLFFFFVLIFVKIIYSYSVDHFSSHVLEIYFHCDTIDMNRKESGNAMARMGRNNEQGGEKMRREIDR